MTPFRIFTRSLRRGPAILPIGPPAELTVRALRARLDAAAQRRLGRSLALRHLDSGSCNGCELELHALNTIVYDLERFGLRFVASPRHADVLLVTGPVTRNLREALERTREAMPEPNFVVAIGDCAVDGGVFAGSHACGGGITGLPVDLLVRGCPPTPLQVLEGLLALLEANAPPAPRSTRRSPP